jgi:hypothetical protein
MNPGGRGRGQKLDGDSDFDIVPCDALRGGALHQSRPLDLRASGADPSRCDLSNGDTAE